MLISVFFRTSTFPLNRNISRSFYSIKSLNSFLYTLNISISIILNFTNIPRGKANTNVNFPKYDIMMTFLKYWNVNVIVWNYIQIITKYMIDARKWIVYSISRLFDNLFISSWWCESIKCTTICIGNIVIAPFWASTMKISSKNRTSRKSIVYMIHKNI